MLFLGASEKRKRIRKNIIAPTKSTEGQANPSSGFIKQQDTNDTAERTKNETTPTPEYWPTIPLPDFNDEDVNVTLQCKDTWLSCRGRCTQDRELGGTEERLQCFCDLSCELFQDCCADFDQYCSSSGYQNNHHQRIGLGNVSRIIIRVNSLECG